MRFRGKSFDFAISLHGKRRVYEQLIRKMIHRARFDVSGIVLRAEGAKAALLRALSFGGAAEKRAGDDNYRESAVFVNFAAALSAKWQHYLRPIILAHYKLLLVAPIFRHFSSRVLMTMPVAKRLT